MPGPSLDVNVTNIYITSRGARKKFFETIECGDVGASAMERQLRVLQLFGAPSPRR